MRSFQDTGEGVLGNSTFGRCHDALLRCVPARGPVHSSALHGNDRGAGSLLGGCLLLALVVAVSFAATLVI